MKKTRKGIFIRSSIVSIVAVLCIGVIASHMYFVYMSGQYVNITRQTEEEIYFVRNQIVQIASTGVQGIDMHNVIASHLVVVEPMTVSSAHRYTRGEMDFGRGDH